MTEIPDIEKKFTAHDNDKYTTTPDFNVLAPNTFNARLPQANVTTKTDFE